MEYIATLVCGLPEESRVVRKLTGRNYTTEQMLLASAVDRLSLLWWAQTKDGHKNRNRPKLIVEMMQKKEPEIKSFDSAEDFEAERKRIIGEIKNGKCNRNS